MTGVQVAKLVVCYGSGGLSDVGRHAVQAALERKSEVAHVTVLTQHPHLLEESNWKCGCQQPHCFTDEDRSRFNVVHVKSWEQQEDLVAHFKDATAVISCLGNRQPFIGDWVAEVGNKAVMNAMKKNNISRVVAITSCGVEEDWPAMEFFTIGKIIMSLIFLTCGRRMFRDLTNMERAYRKSDLDYLLVRPVGIGEDIVPNGKWSVQKEKYKDVLGISMAKLDVARYMVEEALNPTRVNDAVVLGPDSPNPK